MTPRPSHHESLAMLCYGSEVFEDMLYSRNLLSYVISTGSRTLESDSA